MADNTVIPAATGGDTVRTVAKTGNSPAKTQVVILDAGGGADGSPETPLAAGTAGAPASTVLSVQGVASGTAVPVSGTFWQTTQPVSLASLPVLATGANTIGAVTQSGAWSVSVSGTATVSGTVTANLGTLNGAATDAHLTNVQSAPGSSASTALTIQGSASGVAIPVTGSLSATIGGFAPGGAYATPLSVSTSSANVALPTGVVVVVYNTGASTAFVKLGTSNAVTASTSNDAIPAGGWMALTVGANTWLAAITASGSTTLNLSGGAGIATGAGGGGGSGGGTVTLGAGSALIGGAQIVDSGGTNKAAVDSAGNVQISSNADATGGSTAYFNAALSTTVAAIKASAGNLYGLSIQNPNVAPAWVQLFNLATGGVTLGSTTPALSFLVPAQVGVNPGVYDLDLSSESKISFSTAISVAATTTATGSTAPTTGLTFNAWFK